jgi:hypothetical protein
VMLKMQRNTMDDCGTFKVSGICEAEYVREIGTWIREGGERVFIASVVTKSLIQYGFMEYRDNYRFSSSPLDFHCETFQEKTSNVHKLKSHQLYKVEYRN